MVVGGLTNNILAPQYVEKQHAEKVIYCFFSSAVLAKKILAQSVMCLHIVPMAAMLPDQRRHLPCI